MKFNIEMYYQAECLEQRKFSGIDIPNAIPGVGDKMHIVFKNSAITESYGSTWVVHDRMFLYFKDGEQLQTVQLYIRPYVLETYHDL